MVSAVKHERVSRKAFSGLGAAQASRICAAGDSLPRSAGKPANRWKLLMMSVFASASVSVADVSHAAPLTYAWTGFENSGWIQIEDQLIGQNGQFGAGAVISARAGGVSRFGPSWFFEISRQSGTLSFSGLAFDGNSSDGFSSFTTGISEVTGTVNRFQNWNQLTSFSIRSGPFATQNSAQSSASLSAFSSGSFFGVAGQNVFGGSAILGISNHISGGLFPVPPGTTPVNPVLPTVALPDGGFLFTNPVTGGTTRFYDPIVAIGFDFEAAGMDTKFRSVTIPNDYGDGLFTIFIFDEATGQYKDSGRTIAKGEEFLFASLGFDMGVSKFSVRGIEVAAAVDPTDPQAFVTGLSFISTGEHSFFMKPITFDTDDDGTRVPAPASWLLLLIGGLALARARLSRRSVT